MRENLQFLRRLYDLLLSLYPKGYREEYGSELQTVFDLSLDEAASISGFEAGRLVLRELFSLPKAIIHEHLRQRRMSKMTGKFASRFDFAPGSRTEILAALAPFLLFGALPTLLGYFHVMDDAPLWLHIAWVIVFWGFGLSLLVVGFVKRFPRWFMPYIGVPMSFLSLLLFTVLIEKLQGTWWYRLPGFLSEFLQQGLLWMGLLIMVILLLVSTRLSPKSRPFYQRLKDDWTLLAFILYGTTPFALILTFDDYQNEGPYLLTAYLILAIGGWFYLRNSEPWKRFWSLFIGLALSMAIAAVGKAILYSSPSWYLPHSGTWQIEFMSTIVMWMWLAMIMLIAPALTLLPRSENPPQTV